MALTSMAQGGKWLRPPHDAPPVYIAPKQIEAHWKRLTGDGWIPCDDPRRDQPPANAVPVEDAKEIALQARIDQLEAMVQQLLAMKKNEQANAGTINVISTDSQDPHDDSGPKRRKSTV